MTRFVDQLRQLAGNVLGPVAEQEVARIKAMLKDKAAHGFREAQIAEFYFSRHEHLGTAKVDQLLRSVSLEGPIQHICEVLSREGVEISFSTELRYKHHPKGGGVVTLVTARW